MAPMAESDGKTTAELAEEALRTTSNWMYDDGLTDHDADEGARLKALADTARAALFARIAADAEEREALERDAALGRNVRAICETDTLCISIDPCDCTHYRTWEALELDGPITTGHSLDAAVAALAARLAADTD